MYTYRWVSLMVWLYFTEGVVRAWSDTNGMGQLLALVEVLLRLVLFVACAWHVRARGCATPRPPPAPPGGFPPMTTSASSAALLERLRAIVGANHVLNEGDPHRLRTGLAQALARQGAGRGAPGQHAAGGRGGQGLRRGRHRRRCPQGGNTGLAVGSIPDDSGTQVVLSLQRLERHPRHRRGQPHDDGGGRLHRCRPCRSTAEKPASCSR